MTGVIGSMCRREVVLLLLRAKPLRRRLACQNSG